MPKSAEVCLFPLRWRTQAVHRGIVRDGRGRPDTRHHSSQIPARFGGEDASATNPESHPTPEGSDPHAYRSEVLVSRERLAHGSHLSLTPTVNASDSTLFES